MGVVPIVNENDTISVSVRPISLHSRSLDSVCLVSLTKSRNVQEIKFGDNDTLSAITSSMVHADYLFLLTDVDGLYLSNPRKDPDAKFLEVVSSVAEARLEGREPANSSLHHLASFIYLFPVFIPPTALPPTFHPLLLLSPSLPRTQKERN
jgi:glutamate 5-kinase